MTLSDSLADHLHRPNHRALPDLPLVVVQGPVHSGKSALLSELDGRWRRRAPVVRIALKEDANSRPYKVAVAVADELVRRTPVPRHMFRRLFLGVAALKPDLPHDPVEAMRTLQDHLRRRDNVMTDVRTAVDGARQVLAALPQAEVPPGTGAGLAAVLPLMWLLRRQLSAWRWFAGATGSNSGIAGLVELNRLHRINDRRAEVETLLLQAFLADLARAFTRWRHSDRLKHNVLLLIDSVDTTDAPLRFVDKLLDARRIEAERSGRGDPLLVVATCGIRTASGVADFPWSRKVIGPSGPFDVDLTLRGRAGPAPVHVVDLGHNLPGEPRPGDVVDRWSRSLSGGHRWAYARMSENGRALPKGRGMSRDTLFPTRLATEIVETALPAATHELRLDVQILSAINPRDPHADEAFLAVLAPRDKPGIPMEDALTRRTRAKEHVSRKLWAGPAAEALHPVFRRAFLAQLSQAQSPMPWEEVFARLAGVHSAKVHGSNVHGEDEDWEQHYNLARTGDVEAAVGYLTQRLDGSDARTWLTALTRITAAPRKRATGTDTETWLAALTRITAVLPNRAVPAAGSDSGTDGRNEREPHVADLVTTLWLSRNHCGGAEHEEFEKVAMALRQLTRTRLSGTLTEALFTHATEFSARQQFLDELV